jgi:hypothetical protein
METKNTLFSSAFKSGLILGVVSIIVFIVMYVADIKPVGIMMPILMLVIATAISITVLVVLFKKYRTEVGGFISFRDAFLYCFIAFSVSVVLSQFFSYMFITLVEPDYYKNIMDAQKTWMENYLSGKVSDEQMTEALDKIDAQAADMNKISTVFKNIAGSVLFGGIVSLIIGAIMKKKPDLFDTNAGGAI